MEIFCDMIRDLLPLYAEDMVSPATKEAVRSHLAECPACAGWMEENCREISLPAQDAGGAMHRVEQSIRRRRRNTAVFAMLLALTVSMWLYLFLNRREYLPADRAVAAVTEVGDRVQIQWTHRVSNFEASYVTWPDEESLTYHLVAYTTRWDRLTDGTRGREGYTFSCSRDSAKRIYYTDSNTGDFDVLLWGTPPDGFVTSLPRLAMHYYFLIALFCGAALLLLSVLLRKKRAGKLLRRAGGFFWCYALCSFLAAEGDWRVYGDVNFTVWFCMNMVFALLVWLTLLTGGRLWKLRRTDML